MKWRHEWRRECHITCRSTRTRCGKGPHGAVGNRAPCGPLPQRAGHLHVKPWEAAFPRTPPRRRDDFGSSGFVEGLAPRRRERLLAWASLLLQGSRFDAAERSRECTRERQVEFEAVGLVSSVYISRRTALTIAASPRKAGTAPLRARSRSAGERRRCSYRGWLGIMSSVAPSSAAPNLSVDTDAQRQGAAQRRLRSCAARRLAAGCRSPLR